MYLGYYGLQKEPFHITPDPEFLFLNESHKEALASLIYGIEKRKGFVAITGGIGLGKTTIVRSYLETRDDGHNKIIYVFHANITFRELLKTVLQELGLENSDEDTFGMVNRLHLALIREYEAGNNVVVIIDEAQNMPVETLENLRMLSNLETSNDKLIQIVFIGQQEFDALLNRQELRQLKQRIALRTSIRPLNCRESHEYINHRLGLAGLREGPIFTLPAAQRIVREAKGVPRTINILCDNALITGFGLEQKPVGLKVANEVISDLRGRKFVWAKRPYIAVTALGLAIIAVLVFFYWDGLSKWVHEDLFSVNTKPEAVRIPIKPEPTAPEHVQNTVGVGPYGNSRNEARGDDEQKKGRISGATTVEPSEQESANPQLEPTRQKRARTSLSTSGGRVSPRAVKSDAGSVANQGEVDISVKPIDVSKDVDDRLLQMIKQAGPSVKPAGEEGTSP